MRLVWRNAVALALCAAAACGAAGERVQAPFVVPEAHRPKLIMGREYWTMLESNPYTDPYY